MNKTEKELNESNLTVEYEITVRDKHGKVIEHRKEQSNSLIKNFLLLLNAAFNVSTKNVVDTGGTTRAGYAVGSYTVWKNVMTYTIQGCAPGGWTGTEDAGSDVSGIVIGTSDTAVSADDYNLGAKILHGDGVSDKMYYYSSNIYDPTVNGAIVKQKFDRNFLNNSGAGITVKEIGLVVVGGYNVMIIRDVITPVLVPNGSSITVRYFIKTGG